MAGRIEYVDGPRFALGVRAAADWVTANRDELNRINVFPVPDGDTGTNFSLTLRGVADALLALGEAPLSETTAVASRAAIMSARGNSGMMLAQFIIGVSAGLGDRRTANAMELAAAVRQGADYLARSLEEPREGTILTVARDVATAAERAATPEEDVTEFLRRLHREADAVLAKTPEMMAVLKEAGVVDAGGKGFVRMIEGLLRFIDGAPLLAATALPDLGVLSPAALAAVDTDRDFRYCTEVLVTGSMLPPANDVRAAMHRLGGSVVVAVTADLLKIHVHTDTPEAAFTLAETWGTISSRKAEDMRAQHHRLGHLTKRRVAVVVDSSCDLSDAVLDKYQMIMVPLQVIFADESFQDRIELKPGHFYQKLRQTKALPTTSQPLPAAFIRAFRAAREEADEVVGVFLGSALSGTLASAKVALTTAGIDRVHLVDSASASLGLGLLALRGAELAEAGWQGEQIARELRRVRAQSGMFITVDRYENLLRSGRVSKGKAWLGEWLDIKPILEVTPEGRLVPVDRVRGQDRLVPRVLEILRERLPVQPERLRFGIVHAEAPEAAERLRSALVAAYGPVEIHLGIATGVLGTHTGEGAWGVCYQVDDPPVKEVR